MKDENGKRLLQLQDEHQSLEQELRQLERRAFLTPGEQQAARLIKKEKLRRKDQMAALRGS